MSGPEIFKTLPMSKGNSLNLLLDASQPTDSLDRWQAEVVCEGDREGVEPFEVPAHWHRGHSELMTVVEGRLRATVDGRETVVRAGESITIPAGTVHALKGFRGERLVARERADPAGDYKAAFFNDVMSEGWPTTFWHSMRAFYDGDAYPALGLGWKGFDVAFVTFFGGIAKLVLPAKQKLE